MQGTVDGPPDRRPRSRVPWYRRRGGAAGDVDRRDHAPIPQYAQRCGLRFRATGEPGRSVHLHATDPHSWAVTRIRIHIRWWIFRRHDGWGRSGPRRNQGCTIDGFPAKWTPNRRKEWGILTGPRARFDAVVRELAGIEGRSGKLAWKVSHQRLLPRLPSCG